MNWAIARNCNSSTGRINAVLLPESSEPDARLPMDRLLPLRALCRLLAVRRKTLLAWIAAGEFPESVQLPGGKRRWRASTVAAWLATLAGGAVDTGALDLSRLPVLAQEMIQALAESEEECVNGPDLAAKIGGDVDINGGTWGRAVRALKRFKPPLLDSDRSRGYWLTAAGHAAAATLLGKTPGVLPAG